MSIIETLWVIGKGFLILSFITLFLAVSATEFGQFLWGLGAMIFFCWIVGSCASGRFL